LTEEPELFQKKGNSLHFAGEDLAARVNEDFQTPCYVFSAQEISKNITKILSAFTKHYPKVSLAYSMKNNSLPEIISLLAGKLQHFEANSVMELELLEQCAREQGLLLRPITTNIYKSAALVTKMISSRYFHEPLFAIDSYQDFVNLNRLAEQKKKKLTVFVRVNPGFKATATDAVFSSAGIDSKCGVIIANIDPVLASLEENFAENGFLAKRQNLPEKDTAEHLIQKVIHSKSLLLRGLHFHPGSQITDLTYFERFFAVASTFFNQMMTRFGVHLEVLDLGGGYPVQYSPLEQVPSLEVIARTLVAQLKRQAITPEIILESGRFITANAGVLLTRVNLIKELATGQKVAIMDFSVYSDLLDVLTASWYYEPLLVNNLLREDTLSQNTRWLLVGSTNDVLDSLSPSYKQNTSKEKNSLLRTGFSFPRELRVGDLIAIKNAGAYTTCFNSKYAGKPPPARYLLP